MIGAELIKLCKRQMTLVLLHTCRHNSHSELNFAGNIQVQFAHSSEPHGVEHPESAGLALCDSLCVGVDNNIWHCAGNHTDGQFGW